MFTKKDLKNGDVCVCRDEDTYIAIPDVNCLKNKDGYNYIREYNDDLTIKSPYPQFDIIKVYRPQESYQCSFDKSQYSEGNLVFDRKRDPAQELTVTEIKEKLGYKIKIVGE